MRVSGTEGTNESTGRYVMPSMDPIANVIVLVAAGIGAILVVVCAVQLLRHRGDTADRGRLSTGQDG